MTTNVPNLCTRHSARSVFAKGMLNHLASTHQKGIRAHSAGSAPSGHINRFAIESLTAAGVDTRDYDSKGWAVFSRRDARPMHVVITVCDDAVTEAGPVWPGSPVQVHWRDPDPSKTPASDNAKRRAFEVTSQASNDASPGHITAPFHHVVTLPRLAPNRRPT